MGGDGRGVQGRSDGLDALYIPQQDRRRHATGRRSAPRWRGLLTRPPSLSAIRRRAATAAAPGGGMGGDC
eukprot:353436-Chlamydomonas_euryale.AAC.14